MSKNRGAFKTSLNEVLLHTYGDIGNNYFECYAGCGAIMSVNTKCILHRGHIKSFADGGEDSIDNLRPECRSCNSTHLTQNMFDFMKTYKRTPPVKDVKFETHYFNPANVLDARIFETRLIRHECVNNTLNYYKKYDNLHGIISAPTGVGKTVLALETIGNIMREKGGGVLLWITERRDIIGTQFTPYNIMSWKENNIIPKQTSILFKDHLKYCDKFPNYCIIASTIDTAMSKNKEHESQYYQKLLKLDNFLGVVIDETHMAEGDKTYEMIRELLPHSTILMGLSATHKFDDRMNHMYGIDINGERKITPENVFLEYNYMQAIMDGIIRQVDFKISRADRIATDIQGACLFDRVSETSKQKIYDQVMEICNGTFHKKGIIWCGGIKAAEKWYNYFIRQALPDIKIVIDHSHLSQIKSKESFDAFCAAESNIIMIAARKHSQGVDVKNLDFGAIIDDKPLRDVRVFLQMVGRLTRKSNDTTDNAIFCEFIVSASEEEYTKNIKEMIEEYYFSISERFSPFSGKSPPSAEDFAVGRGKSGNFTTAIKHINGPSIQFEILDGLSDISIFSRDEVFIANLLCRTGRGGVSYDDIKQFLRFNSVTDPAEAEMLFRELYDLGCYVDYIVIKYNGKRIQIDEKTFKGLVNWWGIVRYMGINYNILLDIDSSKYYKTLEEAKRAINSIIFDIKNYQNIDVMKLYNIMRESDNKLPPDPLSSYSQKSIKNIIYICYEN